MNFNIDSWPWKFAVVFALLAMRQFILVLTPKDNRSEANETSKWLVETIDSAAIAIGLVLFIIQPFILQAFYIPSGSMEDTLRVSDRLLVSKLVYRLREPDFQDVIVFRAPPAALLTSGGNPTDRTDFIKRCIGLPGDTVYVIDRKVYRNGKLVPEPYTKWSESPSTSDGASPDEIRVLSGRASYDMKIVNGTVYSRMYENGTTPGLWSASNYAVPDADQQGVTDAKPGKVPEGTFLMLGDHRSNSNDGHVWGFVPRENIVGKAICVFWPPTRLGLVDHMSFNPRKP